MSLSVPVDRDSSVVELELVHDGRTHRLSHVASTFIIYTQPTTLPPGEADLYIRVDGAESLHHVHPPHGASPEPPRAEIERP